MVIESMQDTIVGFEDIAAAFMPNSQKTDTGLWYLLNFEDYEKSPLIDSQKASYLEQVAKSIDTSKVRVTKPANPGQQLRSFNEGVTPKSIRSLLSLKDSGISLPLKYDSEEFESINVLLSFVALTNSIQSDYAANFRRPFSSPYLDSKLDIFEMQKLPHVDHTYELTKSQAAIGRLLTSMGIKKEGRIGEGMQLSQVQMELLDFANSDSPDSFKAYERIFDLALCIMSVNMFPIHKYTIRFETPNMKSEELADKLAIQFKSVLQTVMPSQSWDYVIRQYSNPNGDKNMLHHADFTLKADASFHLAKSYPQVLINLDQFKNHEVYAPLLLRAQK